MYLIVPNALAAQRLLVKPVREKNFDCFSMMRPFASCETKFQVCQELLTELTKCRLCRVT